MLVLKLAFYEDMDFVEDLHKLIDILKKKGITIGLVERIEGETHIIDIMCDDSDYDEKLVDRVNIYVSNLLFRFVIDQYRRKELYQFLTDTYFFLKQDEILDVEEQIIMILNMEERLNNDIFVYCFNKINSIVDKIKGCIEENGEININGFITFRMRELTEDIEDLVDKIVEKYIVEKEYEEFIRLLKYFVEIQESKIERVDIYINSFGLYTIEDEQGRDILSIFLKELTTSDMNIVDVNTEDIVISGLITNVPNKINIYGYQNCKNKEFINTIVNVFGERVEFSGNMKSRELSVNKVLTE